MLLLYHKFTKNATFVFRRGMILLNEVPFIDVKII